MKLEAMMLRIANNLKRDLNEFALELRDKPRATVREFFRNRFIENIQFWVIVIIIVALFMSFIAVIQAFTILTVLNKTSTENIPDWLQAFSSLLQVPLLAVASIALFKWSKELDAKPRIEVGIYHCNELRFTAEKADKLRLIAQNKIPTGGNAGFIIMVRNQGKKGLVHPKFEFSSVMPLFRNERELSSRFSRVPININDFVGFRKSEIHNHSDEYEFLVVCNPTDVMHPHEVWSFRGIICKSGDPNGYNFQYDLGMLRIRVWADNLEQVAEQYVVVSYGDLDSQNHGNVERTISQRHFEVQ